MKKLSLLILFLSYLFLLFHPVENSSLLQLPNHTQIAIAPEFEEEMIRQGIDKSGKKDGLICYGDIKRVDSLYLTGTQITSLKGVGYFTNLRSLTLHLTGVDSLNLGQNTKLAYLHCETGSENSSVSPKISYLNVRNCKALTYLTLHKNVSEAPYNDENIQSETLDIFKIRSFKTDHFTAELILTSVILYYLFSKKLANKRDPEF